MVFLQCQPEHLDRVIRFYRLVVRHLEATVNYPQWSDKHPSDEGITDAANNGDLYLCMDGGEIIGALILSENPEGYYEAGDWSVPLRRGEYLSVHVLAVHPDYAKRGVGSFMVDGMIGIARQNGYKAIRLDVVKENTPAVALYTKKGFQFAGTKDLKRNIPGLDTFDLYELNL